MWCHLLFAVLVVFVSVWAGPGPDSLSVNYEASHAGCKYSNKNKNKNNNAKDNDNNNDNDVAEVLEETHLNRKKRQTTCDSSALYRTADGTCNNLNNPSWGSAGQTFRRLLDPVYDDGVMTPRQKMVNGSDLPSPRSVSTEVHDFDVQRLSARSSVMMMEWGQFLAHDLTGTPVDSDSMTSDTCCDTSLVTSGELHTDVNSGGPCFPIIISENDNHFTEVENRCMEFVRSFPVTEDNKRQQISELSAFLDGSQVYGSSDAEMLALRQLSGGRLKVNDSTTLTDSYLPESDTNFCIKDDTDASEYCQEAGDSRVNVYPGLGAMHTVFMRYHNYVADELTALSGASDEEVFQNARKIVIAVLQKITYSEYLPMVIGNDAMTTYGLDSDYVYDDTCDATLYNVFATAAFRFGHSQVPDGLMIDGVYTESLDLFSRPQTVVESLDSLVSGLVSYQAENVDRWYSSGLTNHLFEPVDEPYGGLDIVALNIQRGRDHGLPAYNEWREFCGETRLTIEDLPLNAQRRVENVYGDVDNMDLYSAALTEDRVSGVVGATYTCLLGKQFANLRNCDRFWWETEDAALGWSTSFRQRRSTGRGRRPNGNNRTQANNRPQENSRQQDNRAKLQMGRVRLSQIICQVTGITSIQSRVFALPDTNNPSETCVDILANAIDLSLF